MTAKNSVVKFQNIFMNHKSRLIKLNPEYVCMVDQTQMYPSSILPLGLFQGIICKIERLNGGPWSPELLGRSKLKGRSDLKGGDLRPLFMSWLQYSPRPFLIYQAAAITQKPIIS